MALNQVGQCIKSVWGGSNQVVPAVQGDQSALFAPKDNSVSIIFDAYSKKIETSDSLIINRQESKRGLRVEQLANSKRDIGSSAQSNNASSRNMLTSRTDSFNNFRIVKEEEYLNLQSVQGNDQLKEGFKNELTERLEIATKIFSIIDKISDQSIKHLPSDIKIDREKFKKLQDSLLNPRESLRSVQSEACQFLFLVEKLQQFIAKDSGQESAPLDTQQLNTHLYTEQPFLGNSFRDNISAARVNTHVLQSAEDIDLEENLSKMEEAHNSLSREIAMLEGNIAAVNGERNQQQALAKEISQQQKAVKGLQASVDSCVTNPGKINSNQAEIAQLSRQPGLLQAHLDACKEEIQKLANAQDGAANIEYINMRLSTIGDIPEFNFLRLDNLGNSTTRTNYDGMATQVCKGITDKEIKAAFNLAYKGFTATGTDNSTNACLNNKTINQVLTPIKNSVDNATTLAQKLSLLKDLSWLAKGKNFILHTDVTNETKTFMNEQFERLVSGVMQDLGIDLNKFNIKEINAGNYKSILLQLKLSYQAKANELLAQNYNKTRDLRNNVPDGIDANTKLMLTRCTSLREYEEILTKAKTSVNERIETLNQGINEEKKKVEQSVIYTEQLKEAQTALANLQQSKSSIDSNTIDATKLQELNNTLVSKRAEHNALAESIKSSEAKQAQLEERRNAELARLQDESANAEAEKQATQNLMQSLLEITNSAKISKQPPVAAKQVKNNQVNPAPLADSSITNGVSISIREDASTIHQENKLALIEILARFAERNLSISGTKHAFARITSFHTYHGHGYMKAFLKAVKSLHDQDLYSFNLMAAMLGYSDAKQLMLSIDGAIQQLEGSGKYHSLTAKDYTAEGELSLFGNLIDVDRNNRRVFSQKQTEYINRLLAPEAKDPLKGEAKGLLKEKVVLGDVICLKNGGKRIYLECYKSDADGKFKFNEVSPKSEDIRLRKNIEITNQLKVSKQKLFTGCLLDAQEEGSANDTTAPSLSARSGGLISRLKDALTNMAARSTHEGVLDAKAVKKYIDAITARLDTFEKDQLSLNGTEKAQDILMGVLYTGALVATGVAGSELGSKLYEEASEAVVSEVSKIYEDYKAAHPGDSGWDSTTSGNSTSWNSTGPGNSTSWNATGSGNSTNSGNSTSWNATGSGNSTSWNETSPGNSTTSGNNSTNTSTGPVITPCSDKELATQSQAATNFCSAEYGFSEFFSINRDAKPALAAACAEMRNVNLIAALGTAAYNQNGGFMGDGVNRTLSFDVPGKGTATMTFEDLSNADGETQAVITWFEFV